MKKIAIFLFIIIISKISFADDSIQFLTAGKLNSRVIISKTSIANAPTVYFIPGSGPNGPEEMMPGSITLDGNNHPLFLELAKELNSVGLNCVLIGKPGIDFSKQDSLLNFYDKDLYKNLTWNQYLENIESVIEQTKGQFTNNRKFILGHSEGTIAALYLAERRDEYSGLFLLGYAGRNLRKLLHFQAAERINITLNKLDINHDQILSLDEWINFPEFKAFQEENIPFSDFAELGEANYKNIINQYINFNLWKGDVFDGADFYSRMAALKIPVNIFQGELDMQTPVEEALSLKAACKEALKIDCAIHIIKGVGHGFSEPKAPRKDPVFDLTIGPMNNDFIQTIKSAFLELR